MQSIGSREKKRKMKIKILGVIETDGSVTPSATDEEVFQLFEDMPWLTEEDWEEVPSSQLVVEVEAT